MEVDQSSGVMVEMVQYTNMQEPNSPPKVIEESKGNARYAGKAMDGVIRKNQSQQARRSIIAWMARNELNLDCNWHEKATVRRNAIKP
jgi:hypothetical protein